MNNIQQGLSNRGFLLYQEQKKSVGWAYAWWFFFGGLGVHLLYARRFSFFALHWAAGLCILGETMYMSTIIGPIAVAIGYAGWGLMLFFEACILHHQVKDTNLKVLNRLVASGV